MVESEWLASKDPRRILDYLATGLPAKIFGIPVVIEDGSNPPPMPSDRKLRLFACACCRATSPLFVGLPLRVLVQAEEIADGTRKWEGLANEEVHRACTVANDGEKIHGKAMARMCYAATACHWHEPNRDACLSAVLRHTGRLNVKPAVQANLLRDIIGNPFRSVYGPWDCRICHGHDSMAGEEFNAEECPECHGEPSPWLTPTAQIMANECYDERRFDLLPVLADALEDADCPQPLLLEHLRSPGPHVRGCWALDLILGRE